MIKLNPLLDKKAAKKISSLFESNKMVVTNFNLTSKEWWILIDGKEEGPFDLYDLKIHPRFTPDTWVRREGEKKWRQARDVMDLKEVFKDPSTNREQKETDKKIGHEEIALELREDPPHFFIWLVLLLLVLIYVFYRLH